MEKISIGNKIKDYRSKNQLTQQQLATLIGVSSKAISKWENDEGYPDIQNLKRIAQIFNTSVDYLISDQKQDNLNVYNSKSLNLIILSITSLCLMFAKYTPLSINYNDSLNVFVDKENAYFISGYISIKNLFVYGVLDDNGFGIAMLLFVIFNLANLFLLLRGKLKTCLKNKIIYIVMFMLQVYTIVASLIMIQNQINYFADLNPWTQNIPTAFSYIGVFAYILLTLQLVMISIIYGDKIVEHFRLREKKRFSILLKILTSDN